MKSYKEVVKERYDGTEKHVHPYDNTYFILNPVGFYMSNKIRSAFYRCLNLIRKRGVDLTQAKILDIGCGKGEITRFYSEISQCPENIVGMDLSQHRIFSAKKLNNNINYVVGDLLNPPDFHRQFDIISAIDVFMHLSSKDEIISGLKTIEKMLTPDGYFIWYDAYAKNHFKTTKEQDHSGFNPNQMIKLAEEAGFTSVARINVFKKILGRYHSAYLLKHFSKSIVSVLEKFFPGNPGNVVFVFVKLKK